MWARTGCADDDAAYLRELVAAAANLWRVDFGRIYAYGHSNGAAMAYRLACEASDLFAGVIAFAGVPPPVDSAVGCARAPRRCPRPWRRRACSHVQQERQRVRRPLTAGASSRSNMPRRCRPPAEPSICDLCDSALCEMDV